MQDKSIAETFWPNGARFDIPKALYCVPFPADWDSEKTRFLLIEAVVGQGKGRFGGTPERDKCDAVGRKPICFSHSLVYVIDREKMAVAVSYAPFYVRGPISHGGYNILPALPEMEELVVAGMEALTGFFKLRHSAVYKRVPAHLASQNSHRPKYFCVNRLDQNQFNSLNRFIESLHAGPRLYNGRMTTALDYQIAGYTAFNCDRFRRAARMAAGLSTSVMGRVCPWPAFRAAAIVVAATAEKFGINLQDSRHYGPDVSRKMLVRAYRKVLIGKIYQPFLLSREALPDALPIGPVIRAPLVSRRQAMFGMFMPSGVGS